MIYWFIGQPGCGKTTLAKMLKNHCDFRNIPTIHLDGDDLRKIFGGTYKTEHFTKEYRDTNTVKLQSFVEHIDNQGVNVVVSTVNPTRNIREHFKARNKHVIEIYVINNGTHLREGYAVDNFEKPLDNVITIDTEGMLPEDSFRKLLNEL